MIHDPRFEHWLQRVDQVETSNYLLRAATTLGPGMQEQIFRLFKHQQPTPTWMWHAMTAYVRLASCTVADDFTAITKPEMKDFLERLEWPRWDGGDAYTVTEEGRWESVGLILQLLIRCHTRRKSDNAEVSALDQIDVGPLAALPKRTKNPTRPPMTEDHARQAALALHRLPYDPGDSRGPLFKLYLYHILENGKRSTNVDAAEWPDEVRDPTFRITRLRVRRAGGGEKDYAHLDLDDQEQEMVAELRLLVPNPGKYVFRDPVEAAAGRDKPFSMNTKRKLIAEVRQLAGIPTDVGFHIRGMRHFKAMWEMVKGTPGDEIDRILQHVRGSAVTRMHYIGPLDMEQASQTNEMVIGQSAAVHCTNCRTELTPYDLQCRLQTCMAQASPQTTGAVFTRLDNYAEFARKLRRLAAKP